MAITCFLPAALLLASLLAGDAHAQTFRERVAASRAASVLPGKPPLVPAGARVMRDVSYGADPRQRFDVYLPAVTNSAPVIFLVHGGGWANGNKDNPGLVDDKAGYWLPKGTALVSSNYRMLPDTTPAQQAQDVARAVAKAQSLAAGWGADPDRFVLMGHSAGGHLVALLGASAAQLTAAGARRPLGVVSLDSGALDVPALMGMRRVPQLYHNAFGDDRDYWVATSPQHQLRRTALPMLMVCASERRFPTSPCDEGRKFQKAAAGLGVRVEVLPVAMSHAQINRELGQASAYTEAVAKFIRGLLGSRLPTLHKPAQPR
ncbi:MAG: alpha/beta hydrolase [Pseudoxanthomonas sp.]|nr:alpha/beta hydrolase [Pseudoxanthomonas sp.]